MSSLEQQLTEPQSWVGEIRVVPDEQFRVRVRTFTFPAEERLRCPA